MISWLAHTLSQGIAFQKENVFFIYFSANYIKTYKWNFSTDVARDQWSKLDGRDADDGWATSSSAKTHKSNVRLIDEMSQFSLSDVIQNTFFRPDYEKFLTFVFAVWIILKNFLELLLNSCFFSVKSRDEKNDVFKRFRGKYVHLKVPSQRQESRFELTQLSVN